MNSFSPPIVTVLLSSNALTIYFSKSSFFIKGLTLSATLTEHAAWLPVSAKKPLGLGWVGFAASSSSFWICASASGSGTTRALGPESAGSPTRFD